MKRSLPILVIAALLVARLADAGGAISDLKAMQGTWYGTFEEFGGKPPAKDAQDLRLSLVIQGDVYKAYQGENLLMSGRIALDPAQKPRTIDTVFGEGPLKGLTQRGIYEFRDGELFMNVAKPGDARPQGLKTREGSSEVLVRYTRSKK
jgi:uncharacterized protein (TIGR03067 family)